jgi:hypothetical protein
MSKFFNSFFQSLFETVRDWREGSHYRRLCHQARLQVKTVGLASGSGTLKNFFYNHIICPDSAGYLALGEDGGKLKITGICEKDFAGPRLKDAVFINGKRLRPFASGKCAELTIPWDAVIEYFEYDFVSDFLRSYWVLRRVRVVPLVAA